MTKMLKSPLDRVREVTTLYKKLIMDLGLADTHPEIERLREEMNIYIRTGNAWSGTLDLSTYRRNAFIVFPVEKNKEVECTLKTI